MQPPLQPSSDLTPLHILALNGASRAELEQLLLSLRGGGGGGGGLAAAAAAAPPTPSAAADSNNNNNNAFNAPPRPASLPPHPLLNVGLPHDPHFSPLAAACSYGRAYTARHLLDLGADAEGRPGHYTPFILATTLLDWRLSALLLSRGADASFLAPSGGSAFDRAFDHHVFAQCPGALAVDSATALALVAGSPVRRSRDATAAALAVVQRARRSLSKRGSDEQEEWRREMEDAAAALAASASAAEAGASSSSPGRGGGDKQLMLAARLKALERELAARVAVAAAA